MYSRIVVGTVICSCSRSYIHTHVPHCSIWPGYAPPPRRTCYHPKKVSLLTSSWISVVITLAHSTYVRAWTYVCPPPQQKIIHAYLQIKPWSPLYILTYVHRNRERYVLALSKYVMHFQVYLHKHTHNYTHTQCHTFLHLRLWVQNGPDVFDPAISDGGAAGFEEAGHIVSSGETEHSGLLAIFCHSTIQCL